MLEWDCTLLEGSSNFVSLALLSLSRDLSSTLPSSKSTHLLLSLTSLQPCWQRGRQHTRNSLLSSSSRHSALSYPPCCLWHLSPEQRAKHMFTCDGTHQWTSGTGKWKIEWKSITVRSRKSWKEIRSDWQGQVPNKEPSCFKIGDCVCSNTLTGSSAIIRFMKLFIEKLNTEKPKKNSHLSLSEIRLNQIDHCWNLFP